MATNRKVRGKDEFVDVDVETRRKLETLADECGINGETDSPEANAIDQFKCRLLEQPRLLDAAFAMLERDHAKLLNSRFDSPLLSGKRIGDATRRDIRKSASILMALGRAMLVRANQT